MTVVGRISSVKQTPLGDIGSPAPNMRQWAYGILGAALVHAIVAAPYLPKPTPPIADLDAGEDEGPPIGVNLAPVVRPPDPIEEVPPEPEETPVIEERASDSPPPAPPAIPRDPPDLPDIRPKAVPDLWLGDGAGGDGQLSLEEYLALKGWLDEARRKVLQSLSYPDAARRAGLSGSAEVVIVATRVGRVARWSFRTKTGAPMLDREITRAIRSIRRLPRFPEGTAYDELAFVIPIRFELVFQERPGVAGRAEAASNRGAAGRSVSSAASSAPPAAPASSSSLGVGQLRLCATSAADLTARRDAINVRRAELEEMRADYERRADRYIRDRREPPLSVRNMLKRYNEGVAEYDALVSAFEARAAAFSRQCGQGSATWETYAPACRPYRATGNAYCEAYGELWLRVKAGG